MQFIRWLVSFIHHPDPKYESEMELYQEDSHRAQIAAWGRHCAGKEH